MKLSKFRRNDRGAVAAFAALVMSFALLPMSALVVDVGSLYVEREELQSGADAAALEVALACAAGDCGDPADVSTQWTSAKGYANANAKDGRTSIAELCGKWGVLPGCSTTDPNRLSACVGPEPTESYVEVRVHTELADGSTLLPPTFAQTIAGNEGYQGSTVATCSRATFASICVNATNAKYTHTFDGALGKAKITAVRPLCNGEQQPFTLVSYTAPNSSFSVPQYMYESQTGTITPKTTTLTFDIHVPACFTQVDFVFGSTAVNPLESAVYGDKKVGSPGPPGSTSSGPHAWYNGGTWACTPMPTVAFVSQCDGSMKVNLGNGSGANVDAAFTVTSGGKDQFLRVAKGTSHPLMINASEASTVTVEDSTFHTVTGHWSHPPTC